MATLKKINLSTVISYPIKAAVDKHCKAKGLKLQYFVEEALTEKLEDILDIEDYQKRKDEPSFSLDEVLKELKK